MNRDNLDFANEKIGRLFRAMFFPTLVGMLFNSALNIFDGMFVGHGVGSDALAAINIVAPLFLVCTGIGLMFGIGASVIGGIRLSEGNVKAARIIMTQAYIVGALIFGAIILVCCVATAPVLYLFGCSPRLYDYAADYLLWLMPGLFFLYLQCAGMMLIRLDGSPKYAMSVQIVSALLNIVLDYVMVFPLGMGIAGASIATSISCVVGGSMVLLYFLFFSDKLKFYRLKMSVKSLRLSLRNTLYMARIGGATFLSELAIGVTMVAGNYVFMARLGEDGVAAFSVGCYLFPLLFSINNAVAQSVQPIISYNYGIDAVARVSRTLSLAIRTAIACGAATLAGMWLGAGALSEVFIAPDTPAFALAVKGLPLLALCTIFFAVNITLIGYYQSIERGGIAIFYSLLRGIIFTVPSFLLLPLVFGTAGLWLAIPCAELLTMLWIIIRFRASGTPARKPQAE